MLPEDRLGLTSNLEEAEVVTEEVIECVEPDSRMDEVVAERAILSPPVKSPIKPIGCVCPLECEAEILRIPLILLHEKLAPGRKVFISSSDPAPESLSSDASPSFAIMLQSTTGEGEGGEELPTSCV